jgi:predicted DNA-binding WGR domain protein
VAVAVAVAEDDLAARRHGGSLRRVDHRERDVEPIERGEDGSPPAGHRRARSGSEPADRRHAVARKGASCGKRPYNARLRGRDRMGIEREHGPPFGYGRGVAVRGGTLRGVVRSGCVRREGEVRRFEYIHGNQAKFWEVSRHNATLTMASGRIGGGSKTRTKQLSDYMAAEQEFDRLIRDKLRRGYVEVQQATEPEEPMPDRALRLRPLDGSAPLELRSSATRYLVWRMIEVSAMDKQVQPPDLERWAYRASRRLRLEEVPSSSHPQRTEFYRLFLELSEADRAQETGQHQVVGSYKFATGEDWIVTGREAAWLADAARNRPPRRHKLTANQEQWLQDWIEFNERVAGTGGYVVEVR